ncbi:TolC family protein [Brevibacillus sp. H7]|uniref:TolC family protein n=1 Tax=Brevibacillus sp. H7 TaxID=3349138 RepID=UPI00382545B8
MNFPYSSKKWIAVSMAAFLLTTAGVGAAATTQNTQATTGTPAATQAQAAASDELTVAKAIEQALQTNSALQSKRLEAKNADINARLVNETVGEIPSDFIESLGAAQQKYVTEAKSEMAKKLNALVVKATESATKLGAQKVYYDLLHAKAELELKKQSLNRAQTQLKIAKAAFEVGTKAKTDILQAEMGVAGAQAALASAENNLIISRMKLNEFLGVELTKEWKLSEDNKTLTPNPMTLEQATELALKQRVEMFQKQEELKLAELTRDLIAKYSALSTYQGQVARNDVEKAKLAIEEQKRDISLQVAEAYYNLNAAKLAAEFQKKAKEAAAESYRLTHLRFENGLATTLEVIQAEEELSNRENQYQVAVRNYNLAVVNFETALGN